jgi:hypothetical protein
MYIQKSMCSEAELEKGAACLVAFVGPGMDLHMLVSLSLGLEPDPIKWTPVSTALVDMLAIEALQ